MPFDRHHKNTIGAFLRDGRDGRSEASPAAGPPASFDPLGKPLVGPCEGRTADRAAIG